MIAGYKTLKDIVEKALNTEGESEDDIEAILIGKRGEYSDGPETTFVDDLSDLADHEGHTGHGRENLPGVYVWTADRVYFKLTYSGSEWVDSVPRNPGDDEPPYSFGGG